MGKISSECAISATLMDDWRICSISRNYFSCRGFLIFVLLLEYSMLKWHFYIFLPPFYILEDLLKNNGSFLCDKVQIWVCHLNWKDVSGVMSVFNFVIVCLVFYFGSLVTWLSVSVSHYLQTPSLFKPHPFHLLCHIVFVCKCAQVFAPCLTVLHLQLLSFLSVPWFCPPSHLPPPRLKSLFP